MNSEKLAIILIPNMNTKSHLRGHSLVRYNSPAPKFPADQVGWYESSIPQAALQSLPQQSPDHTQVAEEARGELLDHISANVQSILTQKQYDVYSRYSTGLYTQQQVAAQLGIDQSSVHKQMFGNIIYKPGLPPRRSGGAIYRIQLWCSSDARVQELLQIIRDEESNL